ncbi:MAG: AAA family ATPase, partial [Pseudomonadota bacterium]
LGFARLWWLALSRFLKRRFSVSVAIDNRLAEFSHVLVALEYRGAFARARRFRLTWTGSRTRKGASFVPDEGRFWFVLNGQLVIIDRSINEKAANRNNGQPLETLVLTLPFGRKDTVDAWIAEGRDRIDKVSRIGPQLYIHVGDYWRQAGEVARRPLTTVVCDDDRVEKLVEDVRWFFSAQDWYMQRGVPWRRGYLLYGPPGTGKSSVIRSVASEVDLSIATIDIGRKSLTDDALAEAMVEAPDRSMLVIEDIDAVFSGRDRSSEKGGISFSGLLNAIDGVGAQEGRVLFMTTNHIDALDPALIRPGRADKHVELGYVGATAAREMFLRFFPGEDVLADGFASKLGETRLAPAAIQGWLLSQASDPEAASKATGLVSVRLAAE